jgi:type IV pilus assembly protein PilF
MNRIILLALCALSSQLTGCVTENTYADSGERVNNVDTSPDIVAKNRMALGLRYLRAGNYSQAKFNLDKALTFAPKMPEVHYSLAYYYQTVNEITKANEAYRSVLELDPTNGDALNNYGAFLCQNGKRQDAERFFLLALEQDDYNRESQTYLNLGVCMLEDNQKEQAMAYLQKALDHNPYNGKALLELSALAYKDETPTEALAYLKRYERHGKLTPQSLWLGYQIQARLNNQKAADQYGSSLIKYHPKSSQAKAYLEIIR